MTPALAFEYQYEICKEQQDVNGALHKIGSTAGKRHVLSANVSSSIIISTTSSPKTTVLPVIKPMVNTAGIVKPMVDSAVPSKMLTARCIWLASAARTALMDSGERMTAATSKPPNACGAPMTRTP